MSSPVPPPPPPPLDTAGKLTAEPPITVLFPPCPEVLLGLVKPPRDADGNNAKSFFDQYFKFQQHTNIADPTGALGGQFDPDLTNCMGSGPIFINRPEPADVFNPQIWPPDCCVCPPCVTLNGARDGAVIRRLFLGDAVWLYYFAEGMGIMRIVGAILDDYATRGQFPLSNGALDKTGLEDDVVAVVLEIMVRQVQSGASSRMTDRDSLYRRCVGWTSNKANSNAKSAQLNTEFSEHLHRFIYLALDYYNYRRLAVAIQGQAGIGTRPSVGTLDTISKTLELLKTRFEMFQYGRNLNNTLSGIVWTIGGLALIERLLTSLGIFKAYEVPHEYIPELYRKLVDPNAKSTSTSNRFLDNRTCGESGRDILLDLEVVNVRDTSKGGQLEQWLDQVESKVESYRTAYRNLTGTDLGASGAKPEQQV